MTFSDVVTVLPLSGGTGVCMENADAPKTIIPSNIYLHESSGADGGCLCSSMHNIIEVGHECSLCTMILEKSRGDWAFEWILKLRDWENTLQYEKECRQLTFDLSWEGSADTANRIRDKLGTLQTEMVSMFIFFY